MESKTAVSNSVETAVKLIELHIQSLNGQETQLKNEDENQIVIVSIPY